MAHDRENIKNVELDVGFRVVVSEMRKDVSLQSYGQSKLKDHANCLKNATRPSWNFIVGDAIAKICEISEVWSIFYGNASFKI